jgi:hypothetical protein
MGIEGNSFAHRKVKLKINIWPNLIRKFITILKYFNPKLFYARVRLEKQLNTYV